MLAQAITGLGPTGLIFHYTLTVLSNGGEMMFLSFDVGNPILQNCKQGKRSTVLEITVGTLCLIGEEAFRIVAPAARYKDAA
jgi:hypothetical protein